MTRRQQQIGIVHGYARSNLRMRELSLTQLAIGGHLESMERDAYIWGALTPDRNQHDVIARTLNEFFIETTGGRPVRYFRNK
jgi:hypothetical protein